MSEANLLSIPKKMTNVEQSNTDEYLAFCDYLEEASGITLGTNKAYLVKNRLRPILTAHGVETLADAMKKIKRGADPKLNLVSFGNSASK